MSKYARPEHERRFLLRELPVGFGDRTSGIIDRYVTGTRLRLRAMRPGPRKLTQKASPFLTTIYLDDAEYAALAELPAAVLRKTRHHDPPWSVDVFEGDLAGLVLAEVEVDSAEELASYAVPPFAVAEVSDDTRFTGGRLATTTATELEALLGEFGLSARPV